MVRLLSKEQLKTLTGSCRLLKGSANRPKVALSPENQIIKITYRLTNLLTSSWIYPYRKRFQKRAKQLAQKNIPAPFVNLAYDCPDLGCEVMIYPHSTGQTAKDRLNSAIIVKLAHFIASLHEKGVFFWDLHLDNILMDSDTPSLLDVTTARVQKKPLSIYQRARNMARFLGIEYNAGHLLKKQIKQCLAIYCETLKWDAETTRAFGKALTQAFKKRDNGQLIKELDYV